MERAGCKRLLYGIESGSQKQLDEMKKNITLDDVRTAIHRTRDAGIQALGFFLIGTPAETKETVEETIRFAMDLRLDYAQFHRTMAKPRTELNEHVKSELGYDYWREYVLGNQNEKRLPSPWTDMSQLEIEQEAFRAYRRFYMRPGYIMKNFIGIRSWEEFTRYVRSGLGLLIGKSDIK